MIPMGSARIQTRHANLGALGSQHSSEVPLFFHKSKKETVDHTYGKGLFAPHREKNSRLRTHLPAPRKGQLGPSGQQQAAAH